MKEAPKPQGKRQLTPELAPVTTGFRLSDEGRRLLQAQALQAGVSPHVLARAFVEQVLKGGGSVGQLIALQEEVAELRRLVQCLQRNVAVATAVLLVSAGKSSTEAAKKWVEKNLLEE